MDIVEIVAHAICEAEGAPDDQWEAFEAHARAAIAAYEAAIATAQEAEDERMYVEFHK